MSEKQKQVMQERKNFADWIAEAELENELQSAIRHKAFVTRSKLKGLRSFEAIWKELSQVGNGLSIAEHNEFLDVFRRFAQETHEEGLVAIVPLADSSWMWRMELHSGYLHAGYTNDSEVEFCTNEEMIEHSDKKLIVLDISEVSAAKDAYLKLCDLAGRAVSCGYVLRVQRFGD